MVVCGCGSMVAMTVIGAGRERWEFVKNIIDDQSGLKSVACCAC